MAAKAKATERSDESRDTEHVTLLDDGAAPIGPADVLVFDSESADTLQESEVVLLQLGDLLPDASGEVVLFAESEAPVNLIADVPLAESGIAEAHVTASGLDVTGLHFYSFESGVTVYSPSDLLILDSGGA